MAIPYLFLVLIFAINQYGEGQNHDQQCPELRCGRNGPAIRFPFQLDSQPNSCGFPGFQLSCTHTKETLLELPIPVKLFVKKIDYKSQEIHVYDPHGQCLPRQLLGIDLSTISSHFQPKKEDSLDDYALFNCSHTKLDYYDPPRISCLSGSTYQVYALHNDTDIKEWPKPPCAKVNNLLSFPRNIINGSDNILLMKWSRPACGQCEVQGLSCKLSINGSTDSATRCFLPIKHATSKKSVAAGAIVGSSLLVLAVLFGAYRVYRYNIEEKGNQAKIKEFLEDYKNFKPSRYSYADIKRITDRFTYMLGQGAYGTVFKGKLSNEVHVAVKILNASKGNGEEFINEVGTIGRIHHVNVVRLIGFCADGFRRALVYEFLPNDSLEKLFISSADAKSCFLGWTKLQDIALGIANGIEYLHQGCDQRILHFDIKPHNILLDTNFIPKISDFGLAKLCSKDQSLVSMTTVKGTMGYIAPEVFSRNFGNVSYKADIYSFGMLLLEIVGGRKNMNVTTENTSQDVYFPKWIYNFLEQKEDLRVFIEDDEDENIARKLAIVGLWCIQWHPVDRPSIKSVIQMLEGKGDKLIMPPNPFASIDNNIARINDARMPTMHLNQEIEIIPSQKKLD